MATIIRWVSAVIAVLTGLPLLLTAVFQSITLTGYDSRPTEEISANYLEGSESFIDEAQADSWSIDYRSASFRRQHRYCIFPAVRIRIFYKSFLRLYFLCLLSA